MVLLFRDFYEKQYKVPMCSCIAIVWLLFFALVILIPWVLAWRAGGKLSLIYTYTHTIQSTSYDTTS